VGNSAPMLFQDLGEVLSLQGSSCHSTLRELGDAITTLPLYVQNPMDTPTRFKFQQFKSNTPLSLIKKLIVSTPRLLRGLHIMSLAKADPDGLKNCESKRATLRKCPLVPHVPEKDPVQELCQS
jgi:hypothetical protein